MKRYTPIRLLGLLTATALLWGASTSLYAAGTASNTVISNTATLNYTIGTVAQTQVSSLAATFRVDNKVDLTMLAAGGATVIPGSDDQVLAFTLENTGNSTQGYLLSALQGTGTFNMTNVRIYIDDNNDGAFDVGDDLYTTGTNAGNIAPDTSEDFLIVANTPTNALDLQTDLYHLLATTTAAGATGAAATAITQDTTADDPNTVQVVFADSLGSNDTARSGSQADDGIYTVETAALTVAKISTVVSDPLNNTTNPKRIPGAVVRYTITVSNTGGTAATGAAIVDQIPTNTTFVTGSLSGTNSNGSTPAEAYSILGTIYQAAETTPVAYIRVTHALIAATTGTATAVFDVTIN